MVPRLQKRGSSFKGVCAYILHDPGKATSDRVDWTATQNLLSHPENAWFEMFETYRDSDELKERSGRSARGRKNTAPVLHYMLSWHKDDKPSADHMRETALSSLKALGLEEHQAVLAAHHDKDHLHVHIVVNTVHPDTGITANLKFTKLDLSKWAEAYEKEHGIHCEERLKNNAERERHKKAKHMDATALLMGGHVDPSRHLMEASKTPSNARKPYVPVKDKSASRKQWLEKKEITDRMRTMRATIDVELKAQRDASSGRHIAQRDMLDKQTDAQIDVARDRVKTAYKPKWRALYAAQRKEARLVDGLSGNVLERAAFVYRNRERLGGARGPLSVKQMLPLIRSQKKLSQRIVSIHEVERRALARQSKLESRELTGAIWARHRASMTALRDRQSIERQTERDAHAQKRQSVSFAMAKASIVAEKANEPRPFVRPLPPTPERFREAQAPPARRSVPHVKEVYNDAAVPQAPKISRAEQIKRDNAEWARRNQGKDFGREM